MRICNNCGVMSPEDATVCPSCGLPFAESKASHQPSSEQTDQQQPSQEHTDQQPAFQPQPQPVNIQNTPGSNTNAIISLVCGIAGIVFVLIAPFVANFPALIGFIVSIIAIVFGIKARNELPPGQQGRGMATAGLVCGIIGVVMGAIAVVCSICICTACVACGALGAASSDAAELSEYSRYLDDFVDYFTILFR